MKEVQSAEHKLRFLPYIQSLAKLKMSKPQTDHDNHFCHCHYQANSSLKEHVNTRIEL